MSDLRRSPKSTPDGLLLTAAATAAGDGGLALEGGVFTAGSVVQWLRDELELAPSASEISALAASTDTSGGVMLIPALAGLGSPHWDPDARGAILGLTRADELRRRSHAQRWRQWRFGCAKSLKQWRLGPARLRSCGLMVE